MLSADVRQAVAEDKFHIYPVRTVDEGIEILTGVPAGKVEEDGTYPEGSVHGRVMARLEEIAENLREKKESEQGEPGLEDELDGTGEEARVV
jgi:hypothetical protein